MQRYQVINQPITLYSGILDLNPEQALPRKICLVDMGDGFYEITSAVTFKVGEQFGFDGEVNRSQLERLTLAEPESQESAYSVAAVDPTTPLADSSVSSRKSRGKK